MARITPLEGRQAGLLLKLLNRASKWMYGKEMEPLKVLGHNPRFLLPYTFTNVLINGKTQLDPQIRWLATHLTAHINGCDWCLDFGEAQARKDHVSVEKLKAVHDYATSPLFSPAERAALAFTEAATQVGSQVPDEVFDELKQHFSEREIVELAAAIAIEGFYNQMNASLGIEAQGFCALPFAQASTEAEVAG